MAEAAAGVKRPCCRIRLRRPSGDWLRTVRPTMLPIMTNGQEDRAARLAAALRDNLRRRKAQARARPVSEPAMETGEDRPVPDQT